MPFYFLFWVRTDPHNGVRLRLANRESQLLGAKEDSVRSQTLNPFPHSSQPGPGPPYASSESSPASLPPALLLTPIHHNCHFFPDYSPFCCQINIPEMYFIMLAFSYRGSLKLLDLMCQTVCLFLMPHLGYLAVSLQLLPSLHHLVNKLTHSLTQPLIQVFQVSHPMPAILGQLHWPAVLTLHFLYYDFFNPHLLTSFIRPYPFSPAPPNCKLFNGRGCVFPIS